MRLPWRRPEPPPAVDLSNLAAAREADLIFERRRLTVKRDLIRYDLVAIVAELDSRNPPRGRRSSSVRVIMEPAIVESEATPDG